MATILIVEDDHINYELASELLKYAGHSVLRAENSRQCFDVVNSQNPDLILMDINLPEISGLEITKILKNDSKTKNIPVVAFTAMAMEKDRQNAFEAGCSGFISKPFSVATFASRVESFMMGFDKGLMPPPPVPEMEEISHEIELISRKCKEHNILVVDDNPMNAELLKETLEQLGQKVKIASNGKGAFRAIEEEEFDLVLLDVMMPDISGFELIKQFKANPKTADMPVIFVSALDKTSDIVKGFDLGSYEYIIKPYKIEELKARILSILKIKDLQDQLLSEKKVLDLVFKFSEDGIVLLNLDYNVVSCNTIFSKWMGLKKEEIINRSFCDILFCDHTECLLKYCDSYSYFDFEIPVGKNREKRFIEANNSKISISGENTEGGYVMVLRDVTSKREIEAQKETFVATLTHDLKTPVRAQIKALELLLEGKFGQVSDAQIEILNETLNSNKYMSSMLDNLLSTYKYENGNVVINKQDTDINQLICSCYSKLKHLAEDKKHQVDFLFEEDSLNSCVDPIEIKRVFLNLLSNAINYTDERGKISISTKKEQGNVKILFADTGRGLSEEEKVELFNKFTSYSKRFRQVGTGLGLYLSKKILEKHGGEIFVDSKEGEGSRFTVSLPE